jgi:hypothetical protein
MGGDRLSAGGLNHASNLVRGEQSARYLDSSFGTSRYRLKLRTYFQMTSQKEIKIEIFVIISEWIFHLLSHLISKVKYHSFL